MQGSMVETGFGATLAPRQAQPERARPDEDDIPADEVGEPVENPDPPHFPPPGPPLPSPYPDPHPDPTPPGPFDPDLPQPGETEPPIYSQG